MAMPVFITLAWLAGAFAAVLAGFEPDPYLTHVRHMPAPHPYPTNAAVAAVVLMTVHAGLLAAIWRSWQELRSWRRAAVAQCVCFEAVHAPTPGSVRGWAWICTSSFAGSMNTGYELLKLHT